MATQISVLPDDGSLADATGWSGPVASIQHGAVLEAGCPCGSCAMGRVTDEAGDGLGSLDGSKPVWSLQQIVSNFQRSNAAWDTGATLTYSFREATPPGADAEFSYVQMSEVERSMTRLGFDLIADIVNLNFVEAVDDGRSTGSSDRIYFSKDASAPDYEWGHASRYSIPNPNGGRRVITAAEVVLSSEAVAQRQWFAGGYNFQALMHEMLHTLGIPHPGGYNANGEPITYSANAEYAQDSRQFSIMSYFSASNTGADHTADSKAGIYSGATPLLHDVAALQSLYGANLNTRTGDTVYGYNSTAGRTPFDFNLNATPIFTIWDAGGRDRLDFSGTNFAVNLSLRAGTFSDAFEMTNNISIAHGVTVEDAIGGGGADRLLGNDVGNVLQGAGGNDNISAQAGDDRLEGGDGDDALGGDSGADFMDGGAGTDQLWGGTEGDHMVGGADFDRLWGEDGDDLIGGQDGDDFIDGGSGRDRLFGDGGNDHLIGGSDADALHGQDGDDLIGGQDGDDFIEGGNGRDTLFGDGGNDHLIGGADGDALRGYEGDDLMGGSDGDDFIDGGSGRDNLFGDAGRDHLIGGSEDDRLHGQDGDDLIGGEDGQDFLEGGNGRDNLFGDAGGDHLVGGTDDDRLHGQDGDDLMGGQDGDDYLEGGAGRDRLFGDAGNDLIFGGEGADELSGQAGADRFVFAALSDSGAERDRVFDFNAGEGDLVDVSLIDADVFAAGDQAFALVAGFTGRAGEAVLSFDAGTNTTTLSLDVNGDAGADFRLDLSGLVVGGAGFVL